MTQAISDCNLQIPRDDANQLDGVGVIPYVTPEDFRANIREATRHLMSIRCSSKVERPAEAGKELVQFRPPEL